MMQPIPNLFIVGAPKCGTTSLNHYLAEHPDVFVSSRIKEYNHLNQDLTGGRSGIVSREEYLDYFKEGAAHRYRVDASVWYLYSRDAARRIRELSPDARIVVALRDPATFIPSLHSQRLFSGNESESDLARALELEASRSRGECIPAQCHIPSGLQYRAVAAFSAQLRRFYELFPREQIHVMYYEDMRQDMEGEYRRLLDFLGLPAVMPSQFANHNPTKRARLSFLPRLLRLLRAVPGLRAAARLVLPSREQRVRMASAVVEWNRVEEAVSKPPAELIQRLRADLLPEVRSLAALMPTPPPWPDYGMPPAAAAGGKSAKVGG